MRATSRGGLQTKKPGLKTRPTYPSWSSCPSWLRSSCPSWLPVFVPSWRLRAVRGERVANNLLVVARVDVLVGVRRMYPVDIRQLPPVFGRRGRLDHLRAADLLVPFRTEPRDHELAAIVVDEVAVALTDDETRDPTPSLPGDVLRFPDALAVLRPDATKLTVAADAVDVIALDDGRRDH